MKKVLRSGAALLMAILMLLSCTGTAFAAGRYDTARDYSRTEEYIRLEKLCKSLEHASSLNSHLRYAVDHNSLNTSIKTGQTSYETPIWDYLSRSTRRSIEELSAYQAALKIRESSEYKDANNSALRLQVDRLVEEFTNYHCGYLREDLSAFYPEGTLKLMDVEQLIQLGQQVVKTDAYWQIKDTLDYCLNQRDRYSVNPNLRYEHPDAINAYYADISEGLLTFWLTGLTLS